MKWEKVKLKDCCLSIADGDHQAPPKADKGIPFVTISNIVENCFDFSNTMFVPESYYKSLDDKRRAQEGDILYSVVGSFGISVLIKDNAKFVFQRHIAILRPNANKIDSKFLYYSMLSLDFYAKADSVAVGAAQRTISLNALRNLEINIPTLSFQRRISSILSAYDDLIENNKNQIKLLEEAAQRLYKEWLVDLRFPGHENVPVVDGVPMGWSMRTVSEFGEVVTGKTPPTEKTENYGDDIPFVTIPDMHNKMFPTATAKKLSTIGANTQKNKNIPPQSVMVSCIATVGLVNISHEWCQTNQQINSVILTKKSDLEFFYFSMKDIKSLLDGVGSNGATMTNVNKAKFSSVSILYPSENLVGKFHTFCQPIFNKILTLSRQIEYLVQKRDLLLPKLMSGEIEV